MLGDALRTALAALADRHVSIGDVRGRGLIAAVVCSDQFMRLGTAQAKVFGVPDLPLLQIAHPLGGLGMDKVRERAAVALPQLLKVIREKRA